VKHPLANYLPVTCLLLCANWPLSSSTITASSSNPATAKGAVTTGSASWKPSAIGAKNWWFGDAFFNPKIDWFSGADTADGQSYPETNRGEESKFKLVYNPTTGKYDPAGKTFIGFTNSDGPGPWGSTADTAGSGSSTVTATAATATWSLTAKGTLGTPLAGFTASWNSKASAKDPWNVSDVGLADTDTMYSLFFGASLDAFNFSSDGGVSMSVAYESALGTLSLLNIGIDAGGISLTSGNPAGLSIYHLKSITDDPGTDIGAPLTSAQILSLLQGDMSKDGSLIAPLSFGFLLSGQTKADISPGILGAVHVDSSTWDSASRGAAQAPEPSTCLTIGAALLLLGVLRRRRRAASQYEPRP
jgi:hypothetical protein